MPLHNTVPEMKNSLSQCTISCFTFHQFPLSTLRLNGVNLTRHEIFKGRDLLIRPWIPGASVGQAPARRLLEEQGQQGRGPTTPASICIGSSCSSAPWRVPTPTRGFRGRLLTSAKSAGIKRANSRPPFQLLALILKCDY